jgi:transcription elongation factor Elf1
MYELKNDRYRTARGGTSRVLNICCEKCDAHICYYQKDGPGILKRMYIDRMIDIQPENDILTCKSCEQSLGVLINYKKENRPAYRLFVGAVTKKIINRKNL